MNAEAAYLFRHALLRDAAYQLQLPGDRARLHALAFEAIEQSHGGRAPDLPPLTSGQTAQIPAHALDPFAAELAQHAYLAMQCDDWPRPELTSLRARYLRRAAEHAERCHRIESAQDNWVSLSACIEGAEQGQALRRAAIAAFQQGKLQRAESLCAAAIEVFENEGEPLLRAKALGNLASIDEGFGRSQLAESRHMEALKLLQEAGDVAAAATVLGNLAVMHRQAGRVADSEREQRSVVETRKAAGDRRGEATALGNLAVLLNETGRAKEAEPLFRRALVLARETGDRRVEGILLGAHGSFYTMNGQFDLAKRAFDDALTTLRDAGSRRDEVVVLGNMAHHFYKQGFLHEATELYEQVLIASREVGNRHTEALTLGNLAELHRVAGRFAPACELYETALTLYREYRLRRFEGNHLCGYGLCLLQMGLREEAKAAWRMGAAILAEINESATLRLVEKEMREACEGRGMPPLDAA